MCTGITKLRNNFFENQSKIATIFSCGVVAADHPKCRIVQDVLKPYPDCCQDVICDDLELIKTQINYDLAIAK
jgi:hypothetical protein